MLQWFGFAETEILPAACAWVFPILGMIQYNKQVSFVDDTDSLTKANKINLIILFVTLRRYKRMRYSASSFYSFVDWCVLLVIPQQ